VDCSRGEKDKIFRPNHGLLALYFHLCFPLEDEKGLFQIRMDMGIGLASGFDFPENDFHAIRTRRARTEEPAVGGFGMGGWRISR